MNLKFYSLFLLLSFSPGVFANTISEFFQSKTKIPDPVKLRDPFKAPVSRMIFEFKKPNPTGTDLKKTYLKDGVFSNLPQIEDVPVDQIKITGVLVGSERRAIAKIKDLPTSFILKEGMRIGAEKVEIKAILPGGVVLVEQVANVYGENEYVETIIPISGGAVIEEENNTKTNPSATPAKK